MTEVEWHALLESQNNACAICKTTQVKRWVTDHDHQTNMVRGILCDNCNCGIGFLKDNVVTLKEAIKYLER